MLRKEGGYQPTPRQDGVPPLPKCKPPKVEKTRFAQEDKDDLRYLAGMLIGMSDVIQQGNATLKLMGHRLLNMIKESEE